MLVESEEDVDALEVPDPSRIAYISQTTLSVDETRSIINRLRQRFPAIVGPRTDDICYATTNRQAAVKQLAVQCDLVLVIGSRNSSNSNRLVEVAREHGADSHLIDNETEVREEWLAGKRVVGITSGASAPESLVQRLVESFRVRGTTDVQELEVVQEDVRFMLPKVIRQAGAALDRCARSSSRTSTSARTAGPTSCAERPSARRWSRGCPSSTASCCSATRSSSDMGPYATRWPRARRCWRRWRARSAGVARSW